NIHKRLTNLGIPNRLFPLVGEGHEPWLTKPELVDTITHHTASFLFREVLRPKAQKINGRNSACKGEQIMLEANYFPSSLYCWSASSKAKIISINSNRIVVECLDTGLIQITLVEKNYLDATSEPVSHTIKVLNPPTAGFTVQADNKLKVSLQNTASGYQQITWDMGNGQLINGLINQYTYASPGVYTIVQTVYNDGCSAKFSRTVTVDTCPVALFSYRISGDTLFLFADKGNSTNFEWDVSGTRLTGQNVSLIIFNNGVIPVKLTVANALGCTASSIQFINKVSSVEKIQLLKNAIKLFPNPFVDHFIISNTHDDSHFKIFNLMGNVVFESKLLPGENKIILPNLPCAPYWLVCFDRHGNHSSFQLNKQCFP
ncbi:MAG: hypothetical protein NZ522_09530, partial [Chitinophagales bacterium]|nr:hypothetical protein [Chitinophagales bacterium]